MYTLADCVLVGRLGRSHGVKGELRLELDEEQGYDPDTVLQAVEEHQEIWLLQPRGLKATGVVALRESLGQGVLVQLKGTATRTDADSLRSVPVYLPLEWLPEPDDDDSRPTDDADLTDLIGLVVVDEQHGEIGPVEAIEPLPMQDLLVVRHGEREVLIPAVEALVLGIDPEAGLIHVRLPDGLLEL
jgi:16S rRNA processing protein RimM